MTKKEKAVAVVDPSVPVEGKCPMCGQEMSEKDKHCVACNGTGEVLE